MTWTQRAANLHKCSKPPWDDTIRVGDIWTCDSCGARYSVTNVRSGCDPRPGEGTYGWFEWELIEKGYADWGN